MKKHLIILLMLMNMVFTARSQEKLFGSYTKPPVLSELEAYQKKHKKNIRALGFRISYDNILPHTPVDIIPFARTAEGGQLGFLTDFSSIEDLADAPIVLTFPKLCVECVMIKIIAKNLRSFLMLSAYLDDIYYYQLIEYVREQERHTERYKNVSPEDRFFQISKQSLQQQYDSISLHIEKNKLNVKRLSLLREFGIDSVTDPVEMIRELVRWRNEMTTIKTFDGIGIVYGTSPLTPERYLGDLDNIAAVETFIADSSLPQRLKWYRDVLYLDEFYYLEEENKLAVRAIVFQALKADGYLREANALGSYYHIDGWFNWKKR